MTTLKTYILTIVFELKGDMIRATEYFGEQDARRELDEVGIHWPADSKEIRLIYKMPRGITEEQIDRLNDMIEMGICSDFFVEDVEEETEELNDKLHDLREHIHNAINRGGSYTDDEVSAFLASDHKKVWQQNIDKLRNHINKFC